MTGKLPAAAVGEITLLIAHSGDLVGMLANAAVCAPASSPEIIIRHVAQTANQDLSDLKKIFNALDNIKLYSEDFGTIEKALDRVNNGLDSELSKLFIDARPEIKTAAEIYTDDNPVMLGYKASRLVFQRERLYQSSDILTDARPIFDTAGRDVKQMVITHELVLTYYENNELKKIFVAIDNSDIVKIRKACDRAIIKSQSLRDALKGMCDAEILNDEAGSVD